jgi:hypothetical protein
MRFLGKQLKRQILHTTISAAATTTRRNLREGATRLCRMGGIARDAAAHCVHHAPKITGSLTAAGFSKS